MRILFLHRNFPGQFLHLAPFFARDPGNRVVFITGRKDRAIPGVIKAVYKTAERDRSRTHAYLRPYEEAILHGQAAARVAIDLKARGFVPDVIFGHTWGQTLFMKDVFPHVPLIGYFEWFYRSHGSDADFCSSRALDADSEASIRVRNSHLLVDLYTCDKGVCPTGWQLEQFPPEFRHKLEVVHDGISTEYFKPFPEARLILPEIGLDLSRTREIVTYVSRGLEPYRGFPQFMEALSLVLDRRPECHAVIVGEDRVFYGSPPPGGRTFRQLALDNARLDLSRVHFTGRLPYRLYLRVLQASSAHVYLTYPFVLSWSVLEAMAAGCLVLASDTPPVREVIRDGRNGILFDFFSPRELADKVCHALDHPGETAGIRLGARETILKSYALKDLLPRQVRLITELVRRKADA